MRITHLVQGYKKVASGT